MVYSQLYLTQPSDSDSATNINNNNKLNFHFAGQLYSILKSCPSILRSFSLFSQPSYSITSRSCKSMKQPLQKKMKKKKNISNMFFCSSSSIRTRWHFNIKGTEVVLFFFNRWTTCFCFAPRQLWLEFCCGIARPAIRW